MSRYTDRSIERRRCVSAFLEGMKSSSGSSPRQVVVGKSSCESSNKFGKIGGITRSAKKIQIASGWRW